MEKGGMDLRILSVIIRTASLRPEENRVKSSPSLHYLFANIANFNHFLLGPPPASAAAWP